MARAFFWRGAEELSSAIQGHKTLSATAGAKQQERIVGHTENDGHLECVRREKPVVGSAKVGRSESKSTAVRMVLLSFCLSILPGSLTMVKAGPL